MAGAYSSAYSSAFDIGGGGTNFDETGRLVTITSTVTGTDVLNGAPQNYDETGRLVVIVSTVTGSDSLNTQAVGEGGDVVDGGLRFEAFTPPNVGTFARKFDLSRWVNSYTIAEKYGSISDGRLDLPVDFEKLDRLFKVDKANHANDVGSTIRVLRGTTPITHYVLKGLDDKWSSEGQTLTGLLEGMDYFLDRALVPNFDYPTAPTVEPDWHYGLPSILFNTDLEDGGLTNQLIHVWLQSTVTAGTWTMTFDAQTTSALAWNIDAPALQTAIEALSNITDISITGTGTETNPWVIEVIDPAGTDFNVSTNPAGLTGGVSQILSMTQGGAGVVDPWERAFNPVTGLHHGSYTNFQTSTVQAHGGTTSLYVKGALGDWPESYPGAQQVVSVTGGRTYRASVWVYPLFARKYRFVIRTTDETFIGMVEADLTANSWQQMSMSVTIPNHIRSIIFRVSCISNTDGHEFYLDDALLAPGADAATYGKIMGELLTAVQAQGVLTWVTKTWSDTLDSAGVAWDRNLVWSVKHRQSLLQLVEYADRWNYESDGIHWSIANSRFEWGLYNPAGGGADKQNTGLGVVGKVISQTGTMSKRIPDASHYYAEGDQGYWGEFEDATMAGVWGTLQKSYFNAQGLDTATMVEQATRLVENAADRTDGLITRLQAAPVKPWTDFKPGDRNVMVNLAPKRAREYLRCMAIVASKGPGDAAPAYDVHWGSQVYLGEAHHLETTRRLVRAFSAQRPATSVFDGRPAPVVSATGGSAPSLVVAPANAPESSHDRADFHLPGAGNDHLMWQQVVNRLADGGGGRLLYTEGDATFGGTVILPEAIRMEGMGVTASKLHMATGSNATMFKMASPYIGSVELIGLDLDGHDNLQTAGTWAGIHVQPNSADGQLIIDTCHIHGFRGDGIFSDRSAITCTIDSSQIYGNSRDGLHLFVEGLFIVTTSWIHGNGRYGVKADGAQMILTGNRIEVNGSDGFSAGGIFQGSGVIIANNQFLTNGGNGCYLEGFDSIMAGNYASGNALHGLQAASIAGSPYAVTGNLTFANTQVGLYLNGDGGGTASGNTSNLNGQHGILILDDNWMVQGNRVESNGRTTNNTYDGIHLAASANNNSVLSNLVRQNATGNAQRYGINVLAGATNSWVAGNDVRGTYGTGAYVDAGTGTINVWAGTFGDNY